MSKKLTIEYVRSQFEAEGYELLSEEYKNNKQKLEYRCPQGHEHSIKWAHWQSGHGCPYCYGNNKLTIDFIKKEFSKENYILLSNKYINSYTKLKYECPEGHKHSINWDGWKQKHRCPYCDGQAKPTIEFVKKSFRQEGYQLLSKKYINSNTKLKYICPKGHEHSINWNNWSSKKRCYYCSSLFRDWSQEKITEFGKYRTYIISLSSKNYRKYKDIINPNNLLRKRNKYHLDHIYSIYDGFENNVLPEIISSPINLQMLPESDNVRKSKRSHITLKKLNREYIKFKAS